MRNVAERSLAVVRAREDFPILRRRVHGRPLVYLDNAATTQKPRVVLNAIDPWDEGYRRSRLEERRGEIGVADDALNDSRPEPLGYLCPVALEDADLRSCRVVLGKLGNGFEEPGAASVVKKLRRDTLLSSAQPLEDFRAHVRALRVQIKESDPGAHSGPSARRKPLNCQRSWG